MDWEVMRWRMRLTGRVRHRYRNGTGTTGEKHGRFRQGDRASLGPNLVAERNILAILYVRGVDDLPRCARVDVRGVGYGVLVGGNCLVLKEVIRCIRDKVGRSDAENLSRVNVETVLVDVGVVGIKLGRINSVICLNPTASITWLNNVGGCAVGAFGTQADRLVWHKVAAAVVNGRLVNGHDLIRRCTLSGTDRVASVPRLDRVCTNAGTLGGGNTLGEQWKGAKGSNDERCEHGE